MGGNEIDELGPVDYLVVEFPSGKSVFNGEMADALAQLVDAGTIRLLDLLVIEKEEDGSFAAHEIEDVDLDEVRDFEAHVAEILAAEDVAFLAEAMEPGTVAGVLVWENTWAAPFGSAVRRSGGELLGSGRIPTQALVAAVEADRQAATKGA